MNRGVVIAAIGGVSALLVGGIAYAANKTEEKKPEPEPVGGQTNLNVVQTGVTPTETAFYAVPAYVQEVIPVAPPLPLARRVAPPPPPPPAFRPPIISPLPVPLPFTPPAPPGPPTIRPLPTPLPITPLTPPPGRPPIRPLPIPLPSPFTPPPPRP